MPQSKATSPHVIIAGFGLPGRVVAELMQRNGVSYCVIEKNPETVARCEQLPMVLGDVRDEQALRRAGIERATLMAMAIPDEEAAAEAVGTVRRLRPDLTVLARVHYTSTAMKLRNMGVHEIVVAERLVAEEFDRLTTAHLPELGVTDERE